MAKPKRIACNGSKLTQRTNRLRIKTLKMNKLYKCFQANQVNGLIAALCAKWRLDDIEPIMQRKADRKIVHGGTVYGWPHLSANKDARRL